MVPRADADTLEAALGIPRSAASTTVRIGRANPSLYRRLVFSLLLFFPLACWLILHFMRTPSFEATVVGFAFLAIWGYAIHWSRRFATPAQRPQP